jgi:Plant transposon protein
MQALPLLRRDMEDELGDEDVLVMGLLSASLAVLCRDRSSNFPEHSRGSAIGKARNRNRGRAAEASRLDKLYFCRASPGIRPLFNDREFARRFCISRRIYEMVRGKLCSNGTYFGQSVDAIGVPSATTDQKLIASLRFLATGSACDTLVDTVGLAESTLNTCFKRFCRGVVQMFGGEYLRLPNLAEIRDIERRYSRLGFPGALGCIDCSSIYWSACPVAYHGRYVGKDGKPALRLEVLCDDYLRIWSCSFGFPASMNDISIMHHSPLFNKIVCGEWPLSRPETTISGFHVSWFYFLVDGIYPSYRIFVNSYSDPRTPE